MAMCARCGQQTEAGAEFCRACGANPPGAFPTAAADGFSAGPAVAFQPGSASVLPASSASVFPSGTQPGPLPPALATSLSSLDYLPVPPQGDGTAPSGYAPSAASRTALREWSSPTPGPVPEPMPGSWVGQVPARGPGQRPESPARTPGPARSPHNGRWIALAAAAAVLVGAAAFATVTLNRGQSGHEGSRSGAGASAPARGSRTPGAMATSAAPGTRPVGSNLVAVAPRAAHSPHATAVASFLARYFSAINAHDYAAYRRLFSPAIRSGLSRAEFRAGYRTTRDSAATLHRIRVIAPGQVSALVSFTSHQRAADSPTRSACTSWSITLFLVRQNGSYVLQTPPSGYRAAFRACS